MHPLFKILHTPVMSICLVKQNDGTWVEKHQRFLFNVYKTFFIFVTFFTFFNVFYFFSGTFLHLWFLKILAQNNWENIRKCDFITLHATCGAVYCNQSYLWVGEWVGVFVWVDGGGSVTTITRNCVDRSSPN